MKVVINVQPLVYNRTSGIARIEFITSSGGRSELGIDLQHILAFANLASMDAVDFFIFSASVYGIDRFIERRKNSIDGWSRELKGIFPVTNPDKWKAIGAQVEILLSFLTGDYWEVDFYKAKVSFPSQPINEQFNTSFSQVNLFSGGLDSLIGALDAMNDSTKQRILFISHYDSQMRGPKGDQLDLIKEIESIYASQFTHIPSLRVSLEKSNWPKETTFRSRSILFIGIALLAAQGKGIKSIIVPENGTVSLNYPLSPSRRSSCSTRTTHPAVLNKIRLICKQLEIDVMISNPYEFFTKGEMVVKCKDQHTLQKVVMRSNSCGKRGHVAHWNDRSSSHCGICMPCVYRRASLLSLEDNTSYGNDINLLYPFISQKAQDLGACLEFLKKPLNHKKVREELIVNGIKNLVEINQYADLVLRTRNELITWLKQVGNSIVKSKAGIE